MRILIFLFIAFTAGAQDIKKVEGVLDTDVKSVSGILAEDVARVNGVTLNLNTFTGLLDDYSGAGVAYSVRKLDKDYTGYCMRIKRLSDNSTLDVGFDSNGDLDESAITTFCAGSVDATVTIWYDQSGNGYDLIPNVGNNTLLICDNGVVLEKNGKPAINTGSDEFVVTIDMPDILGANATYMIGTFTYKENSGLGAILIYSFDFTLHPVGIGYLLTGEDFAMGGVNSGSSYVEGTFNGVEGTQYIIEYGIVSSSNSLIYVDGTNVETTDATTSFTATATDENLYIGGASASYPGESVQEVIIWPINQSSNRSSIYTNLFTYYDVTPDPVNWDNISVFYLPSDDENPQNPATISNIGSPITLEITHAAGLTLEYKINSGSWTSISSGGTFSVNNGDSVKFQMVGGVGNTVYTVTVKNVTGGNTTLDTFTCTYIDI